MGRHETRYFRGVLARDVRQAFESMERANWESIKELKVASRLVVVTTDKPGLQGMGFSTET